MKQILFVIFTVAIFSSCNSDKPQCSETQAYEILPKVGIGPYVLGMSENELENFLCSEYTKKEESALFSNKKATYYFLKNMSFICRNNKLREINVWGSFKGNFEDIDLNYDKELLESYGDVVEHNGEYRIIDLPSVAFGKEDSDEGKYIKIYQ